MSPFPAIITNLFQQQNPPTEMPTTSTTPTAPNIPQRLDEMEKKFNVLSTKIWQLGEHLQFLDDEVRRLRAGEPSRRLPTREYNPAEKDDVEKLFRH